MQGRSSVHWRAGALALVGGCVLPSSPHLLAVGGAFWFVLHEMKNDFVGMIGLGIMAHCGGPHRSLSCAATGTTSGATLRPTWPSSWRRSKLPFLAPFVFVFTGGDPTVFTSSADYTNQDMIVRLAIMVAGVRHPAAVGWPCSVRLSP